MANRKLWIPVLAGVLALVAVAGLVAALVPARSPESEECLHESARLVKESGDKKTYYCPDCNERFEREVIEDRFVDNFPELTDGKISYVGNWQVGDFHNGVYKAYDAVYNEKTGNGDIWFVNSSCEGYGSPWDASSGFLWYSNNRSTAVATGCDGHDAVIVWTAPRDGEIIIHFDKFSLSESSVTDCNFVVQHNDDAVVPEDGYIHIKYGAVGDSDTLNEYFEVPINVNVGDRIYFRYSRIDIGTHKALMSSVTYVD